MTTRCKEKIFPALDAMYAGLDFEPEEENRQPVITSRYANVKQRHLY